MYGIFFFLLLFYILWVIASLVSIWWLLVFLRNAADTEPETESEDEFQICNVCKSEEVFVFIFPLLLEQQIFSLFDKHKLYESFYVSF